MKQISIILILSCFVVGTITAQINGPSAVCGAKRTSYSASVFASNYSWSVIGGSLIALPDSPNITVVWDSSPTGIITLQTEQGTYTKNVVKFHAVASASTNNTICPSQSVTLYLSYSGTLVEWQQSINGGASWSNAGYSSTLVVAPSTATQYRALVTTMNSNCPTIYSNIISFNVYPALVAGSIVGNQTICYNQTASYLTSSAAASGSNGAYYYQWQYFNGSTWISINGANSLDYAPGVLTSTTTFRRVVSTSCALLATNEVTVNVYPDLNPGSITSSQTICYANDVSSFGSGANASGGNGSYTYQWQVRSPGGSWSNIAGATASTYDHGILYSTTEFKRVVSSCGQIKDSNVLTITVYPDLSAGTISGNQTICYNADVSAFSSTANATGGNGSYSYQWQSRPLGGGWSNINGATAASYDHGALTSSMEYKRIVSSCGQVKESNVITVTVNPALSAGSISTAQTICYNADVAAFTSVANASGGNGFYTYQWQIRTPGGSWSNVSGANASTYDHGALTTSMEFKRVASSCGQAFDSNIILITVHPDLNPGSITSSQTICYANDVASFGSGANASGGNGSYTYQWQVRSPGGSWSNIAGATASMYDHGILNSTTEFKRVVSSCGQTKDSNVLTVTVYADLSAGTISGNQTVCYNADVSAFSSTTNATGGNGSYSYQWQSRPLGGGWSNISGATAASYDHGALTSSMEYKRIVSSCGQVKESNVITVSVNPALSAGSISSAQTICYNADVAAFTSVANASGGNGVYTYQWQIRTPGGDWSNISGANASTYDHGTLKMSMEFKRVVSSCTQTLESNPILVTVNPYMNAGSISGEQTICSGSDVAAFNSVANASGGNNSYNYQWQSRPPAGTWVNIAGATSATYNHGVLSATTEFKRLVSSCGQLEESNVLIVTTNPVTVGGSLSPNIIEAYGITSGNLTLTAYTGSIQKWQQKIGSGSWTDIANTTNSLAYTNINTSTYYRAVVKSGVCAVQNSSQTAVLIYDVPSINIQGNSSIPPGGSTTIASSSNLFSYQWYHNNQLLPGEISSTLVVTKPGFYKVAAKTTSTSPVYTTGEVEISRNKNNPLMDMNYVTAYSFNIEGVNEQTDLYDLEVADYLESTTYFDGLGRPVQSVSLGAAGNGNDLITSVEYDAYGREAKKYLPYAHAGRDGRYQPNALSDQNDFYDDANNKVADDTAPYALTIFEPSPLNRVIKQGSPGFDWQPNSDNTYNANDHTIKFNYEFNEANEVLNWTFTYPTQAYALSETEFINAFGVISAGTNLAPVYYPANQLYKNKTKDEQGNQVIEYVDKGGRTVLKRVQAETGNPSTTDINRDSNWASTYYLYDDFGNLVCVIPPEATKRLAAEFMQSSLISLERDKFLKRWAFRYRYDGRKRMIMKQVPGAEPVYMVYDNRDRLVLTQDGNQRIQNQWNFTKYDALNRPVMTGLYAHTTLQTQQQMSGNISTTAFAEVLDTNQPHGYTTAIFPNTNLTVHSVTFYDNYNFTLPDAGLNFAGAHLTGQEQGTNTRVRGQVTATKVNILNSTDYLWTVTYYDDKYRPIQIVSQNHVGGIIRTTNKYDFVKLVQTKTTTTTSTTTHSTQRSLVYDAAGRLTETWHKINEQDAVLLVKNEYNELGQLIDKKLHSTLANGSDARQSIDYRYNIRGWLTSSNNAKLNVDENNDDVNDLFGMELGYNNSLGVGNASLYNGNISAIKWSNNTIESDVLQKAYVFSYDALNRLKSANEKKALTFTTWLTGDFHERGLVYDLNGNITKLSRTAENGTVTDSLSYDYGTGSTASNKLLYVNDASGNIAGFNNVNTGTDDYSYDANGNLTTDKNKQITKITYNHLNLPAMVRKGTSDSIRYIYDASGRKLSQQVLGAQAKVMQYVGEFVLENGSIQIVQHEEGRLVPDGSNWQYQYHLKDHLGNVRTTFGTKEITETKTATLETSDQAADYANFLRVAEARRVQSHLFDRSNGVAPSITSGYAQRLNATANERFGLAKSISVMPGDTIRAEVYAKYIDGNSNNWTTALNTLLSQIAAGTATPGTVVDGGSYGSSTSSFTYNPDALTEKQNSGETGPKAYLNWLLFKRDGTLIMNKSGFDRLSATPKEYGQDVAHERLYSPDIIIDEPGFIYIYLSNEEVTPLEVYFDDFTVDHTMKHPVIQSDDYYPFGLTFNSYSRENSTKNNYLYNGNEKVDDLDIGWMDFNARYYDQSIARFISMDVLTELSHDWSPYRFSFNNPLRYNDPLGLYEGEAGKWKAGDNEFNNVLNYFGIGSNNSQNSNVSGGDCPPGARCETDKNGHTKVYDENGNIQQVIPARTSSDDVNEAIAVVGDMLAYGGKGIAEEAAYMVIGGTMFKVVFKGGKWLLTAQRAKKATEVAVDYAKLFKPINQFDPVKTLFRGTTGSEAGSSVLFMTDNAAVAATYVKNGGTVAQYQISEFALKALELSGELSMKTGIHGKAGAVSTEYMFQGAELVKALNAIVRF